VVSVSNSLRAKHFCIFLRDANCEDVDGGSIPSELVIIRGETVVSVSNSLRAKHFCIFLRDANCEDVDGGSIPSELVLFY
jgi:hypothetical protein